jgi:hypothetical protein
MRATAPNPTRRRRAAEVVLPPAAKPPAWHRERPPPRKCVICKKTFPARNFAKTCSPECSRKLWLANRRKYYAANAEKILAQHRKSRRPNIRQCLICGRDFISGKNSKTCSPEHRREHKRFSDHKNYLANREQRLEYERSKRKRAKPVPRQCVICGKGFVVANRKDGRANACSPEHRRQRLRMMERARYHAKHGPISSENRTFT